MSLLGCVPAYRNVPSAGTPPPVPPLVFQTLQMGGRYPAKPENCPMRFEYMNERELPFLARYELLGQVTLNYVSAEFTDVVKDVLRPEACRLGGDVVVFSKFQPENSIRLGRHYTVMNTAGEYSIYRDKMANQVVP